MILSNNKRRKISSILLAFVPILNIYQFDFLPLGMGDIVLVIVMLTVVLASIGNRRRPGHCHFVIFFFVYFILSCISSMVYIRHISMEDFFQKWSRLIVYIYLIDIASETEFDRVIFSKWVIILGMMTSVLLVIQVLVGVLSGVVIKPYFDIPMISLNGGTDISQFIAKQAGYYRFGVIRVSSLFAEPAHFAQFAILPLIIIVFEEDEFLKNKKRICFAAIMTFAILFSGSANGIFLVFTVWIVYLVKQFRRKMKVRYFLPLIAIVGVGLFVLLQTSFLNDAWERLETVQIRNYATTGNQRLLQGLAVYERIPMLAKWFGLGFGNVYAFLIENNITTAYLQKLGNEYMNGFSTVLVSAGIIGLVWYLWIWSRLFFENKESVCRVALLALGILFCTSSVFYSGLTVVYFVYIRCGNRRTNRPVSEKRIGKAYTTNWDKYIQ